MSSDCIMFFFNTLLKQNVRLKFTSNPENVHNAHSLLCFISIIKHEEQVANAVNNVRKWTDLE